MEVDDAPKAVSSFFYPEVMETLLWKPGLPQAPFQQVSLGHSLLISLRFQVASHELFLEREQGSLLAWEMGEGYSREHDVMVAVVHLTVWFLGEVG